LYRTALLHGLKQEILGAYSFVSRNSQELISEVLAISDHSWGLGQAIQEGRRSGASAELACGHEELGRATFSVREYVLLGIRISLLAFFQELALYVWCNFFIRRLEAMQCAFGKVTSIMTA
jgi:hypothetical protein